MTAPTASRPQSAGSSPLIGLIGLGRMGLPIARRLLASRSDLVVWNRSPAAVAEALSAGARAAATPDDLIGHAEIILIMLANSEAADRVLGRSGSALAVSLQGKLLIQLGTTSPDHSRLLALAIARAGGRYVEAPVSGSRIPAERGNLIAMLGAETEADFTAAERVLTSFASHCFRAGSVPAAMTLKLVVNAVLIPLVTAISEAWQLGASLGLDPVLLKAVLDSGPMASEVSRGKLDKLIRGDLSAQASIGDVGMIASLIRDLAAGADCPMELIEACATLLQRKQRAGHGGIDMVAAGLARLDHRQSGRSQ